MTSTGPPGPPAPGETGDAPAARPSRAALTDRADRPARSLIFGITVTGILSNTLITPAIPDIIDHFDVGTWGAGLVIAATAFPGIVVAPLIGLLADRYGRRTVLVPCLAVFGVAGGLGALAPSFWLLVATRLVQGVGAAGLINLAVVIIGDHWSGAERARLIGQNAAVLTASIAVVPPLGGVLTDLGTWRASFLPYWLALGTAVVVHRRLPPSERRDVRIADQAREAMAVLRLPHVTGAIATGFVLFILVFGLFLTAMPIYAHERFGLGASSRGLLLGLPALGSTTAALLLGRLTARFGSRRLVLAASGMFVVAFSAIAGAPSLWVAVLAIVLYGLGEGITIPGLQDLVAGAAPTSTRGSVVAAWVGAARAGQTVGPVLAGVGISQLGAGGTFWAGAVVAAGLLVVQAAVGHRRGDGLDRREQEPRRA